MLGSHEDAEDVLQEVFAASFNAICADDRPINARPWLYRIARNRCLNHLRRPQPSGQDSMDVFERDGGATTADTVHKREEFRQIVADVQELPETQRTALLLREIDALSYDQIAEAMDTTVPSVKSLLVRARVSLAEAAEARLLTCDEVRLELGQVAEGIARTSAPVRRHLKTCERCRTFRVELRKTTKALAAIYPVGPLLLSQEALDRQARLRRERERRRRPPPRRGGAAAGAGVAGAAAAAAASRPAASPPAAPFSAGVSTRRLEGRRRDGRRRDRHRRRRRGEARRPAARSRPRRAGRRVARAGPPVPPPAPRPPRRKPKKQAAKVAEGRGQAEARSRAGRAGAAGGPAGRGASPAPAAAARSRPPAPVQEDGSTVVLPPRADQDPAGDRRRPTEPDRPGHAARRTSRHDARAAAGRARPAAGEPGAGHQPPGRLRRRLDPAPWRARAR